jgi:hypothetical protein
MILAASILAVPVLAATPPGDTTPPSPATTEHAPMAPTNNMRAGMPGASTQHTTPGTTTASKPAAPLYTTASGDVRLGKVVGASVYNDQHQSIGSIDDVLMSGDHKATTAVISVGGFLGMGGKLVSVPFDKLQIGKDRIMMPGATKATLTSMPVFNYKTA